MKKVETLKEVCPSIASVIEKEMQKQKDRIHYLESLLGEKEKELKQSREDNKMLLDEIKAKEC